MSSPLFPLAGQSAPLPRRTFIRGALSFAAAAWCSNRAPGAVGAAPRFQTDPFSLGVASGDPTPDGVVLWTRLAPRPLEPGGGLGADSVDVAWQVVREVLEPEWVWSSSLGPVLPVALRPCGPLDR